MFNPQIVVMKGLTYHAWKTDCLNGQFRFHYTLSQTPVHRLCLMTVMQMDFVSSRSETAAGLLLIK